MQGKLPEALESFEEGRLTIESLVKRDPGNAGWQRDLSVALESIADTQSRLGKNEDARRSFESALAIYEALVAKNPDDVNALVNSVVPHWRLAVLDPPGARRHLQAALDILKPLARENRLDAARREWIPRIEAELAAASPRPAPARTPTRR